MEAETRRQLAGLRWEVDSARLLVSELDREMTLIMRGFCKPCKRHRKTVETCQLLNLSFQMDYAELEARTETARCAYELARSAQADLECQLATFTMLRLEVRV